MIAPRFVGLCGADLQVYRGVRNDAASILGHEGVGIVIETGEAVEKYSPGDPVVFNPVNPINQDENLGSSFDGLFQEKFLVRNVESIDWLIQPLPSNMVCPVGALVEPIATAIYSSELIDKPSAGKTAVIVGDGPVGLLNSIQLRSSGFKTVLMVHGRSTRHQWAVKHGYFNARDMIFGRGDVPARVIERLGGALADVVVVCTSGEAVEQTLRDAIEYIKPKGLINLVSTTVPPVASFAGFDLNISAISRQNHSGHPAPGYIEQVESSASGKVIRITGQRGISASHINAGIELLNERRSKFETLVTKIVDLDDAPLAISSAVGWTFGSRHGSRAMKTVIELNNSMA